ncbi:Oxo-4-hydroxy-4-carboxy-5-ureidoimidazoline decarboxylase [Neurospora hispaniola]|uniref:Oxo-4-hydroxy-4-carboxy-5-ureidoimidazoline decarboxylase n=1 Tax=Neurospora hispaniola TaxID=588809 RepID=A0AAJ0I9K3_9PEZI|nr:Oxo-4-hydroxy-4-carboxy-5-ureidoimidazoline decarboxylase [Neurospora hispaniola]
MSSSHTHSTHLNPEATPFLPAITSLPTLPDAALISTLDLLFEPSPDLHALALPTLRTISFSSYDDLISTLRDELLAIADAVALAAADPSVPQIEKENIQRPLHAILGSHPRLGEPKKETLSAQSQKEQAHLNDSEEVKAELRRLNKEYEDTFPGLRYVVWVNGRGRGEVMGDMRRRIARGDLRAEEREGIEAMCDIAADRAAKLLKSAQEAVEHGSA